MALDDPEIAAELGEEVHAVRSRAPKRAIAVPPVNANTPAGLLAAAAALTDRCRPLRRVPPSRLPRVWRDGRDVSDPVVPGPARHKNRQNGG